MIAAFLQYNLCGLVASHFAYNLKDKLEHEEVQADLIQLDIRRVYRKDNGASG